MPSKPRQSPRRSAPSLDVLAPLGLDHVSEVPLHVVKVRSPTWHPYFYRKRILAFAEAALPGDLIAVEDAQGMHLGYGIYNPRAEIVVRMLSYGAAPPDIGFWKQKLVQAVALRKDLLRLDDVTDAYRVLHAEGDGLSGLVVDRLGDTLSAEAFSLGMYKRGQAVLNELSTLLGTKHTLLRPGPQVHGQEGFLADPVASEGLPRRVTIEEFGTRFRVHFEGGHKTGFFCDQRDNRRKLAEFCEGRTVLDLCCYTGGFAIQAKKLGKAAEVTGVELDEQPLKLARENANLNQVRVNFVQADVFQYMRDLLQNGRRFDVVVLDPPKLIRSRKEIDEGTRKHFDLNRLAIQLVQPGGLFLSCSCAGLLPEEELMRLLSASARQASPESLPADAPPYRGPGRSLQFLEKSGAAADHPVASNCPEGEYLKAVWMAVG